MIQQSYFQICVQGKWNQHVEEYLKAFIAALLMRAKIWNQSKFLRYSMAQQSFFVLGIFKIGPHEPLALADF
jgi:hypothetical protein